MTATVGGCSDDVSYLDGATCVISYCLAAEKLKGDETGQLEASIYRPQSSPLIAFCEDIPNHCEIAWSWSLSIKSIL